MLKIKYNKGIGLKFYPNLKGRDVELFFIFQYDKLKYSNNNCKEVEKNED